jgi:hypothetical protein
VSSFIKDVINEGYETLVPFRSKTGGRRDRGSTAILIGDAMQDWVEQTTRSEVPVIGVTVSKWYRRQLNVREARSRIDDGTTYAIQPMGEAIAITKTSPTVREDKGHLRAALFAPRSPTER